MSADDTEDIDHGQRSTKCEPGEDEQQTSDAETIASTDEDVHPPAQSASHQVGASPADGIHDDHAVAQPGESPAFSATEIQRQDAAEADGTADHLP